MVSLQMEANSNVASKWISICIGWGPLGATGPTLQKFCCGKLQKKHLHQSCKMSIILHGAKPSDSIWPQEKCVNGDTFGIKLSGFVFSNFYLTLWMYVAKRRWPKLCPKIDFPLSNEYPIVYQQSRTPQKQSNNSDGFLNDKPWGTPKVQVWGSYLVL